MNIKIRVVLLDALIFHWLCYDEEKIFLKGKNNRGSL